MKQAGWLTQLSSLALLDAQTTTPWPALPWVAPASHVHACQSPVSELGWGRQFLGVEGSGLGGRKDVIREG